MENEIRLEGSAYSGGMLPCGTVVEDSNGMNQLNLLSLHLSRGRLFIDGEIDMNTANRFASAMLHLADMQSPVDIFINSPGGRVDAGLMMYDIIRSYGRKINMYCTGLAASMGAVLLAGGQRGRRFILPHSRVMIHEPLIAGGLGGSASTIEKTAKNILDIKKQINSILAEHTGKSLSEINKATSADNYMDARQAVDFGICDGIRNIF
ncbi:MAG: ATP-dependent Clp protease proteolytic subunit [Oscillospiraceae bacterium]|nr:ATP-dependent Clp protease proteolytic subunit [Oscillospiraceae bacterium]